jgi:hypothetical protein
MKRNLWEDRETFGEPGDEIPTELALITGEETNSRMAVGHPAHKRQNG